MVCTDWCFCFLSLSFSFFSFLGAVLFYFALRAAAFSVCGALFAEKRKAGIKPTIAARFPLTNPLLDQLFTMPSVAVQTPTFFPFPTLESPHSLAVFAQLPIELRFIIARLALHELLETARIQRFAESRSNLRQFLKMPIKLQLRPCPLPGVEDFFVYEHRWHVVRNDVGVYVDHYCFNRMTEHFVGFHGDSGSETETESVALIR